MNILYCRVGWMEAYKGNSDERPIGGGSYNKNEIGYEIYNYLSNKGSYFGYVETGTNNTRQEQHKSIHLEKMTGDRKANCARDVLVVWVATRLTGGQYILGWYKNATVYRFVQTVPEEAMMQRNLKSHHLYNIYAEDAVLLRNEERTFPIDSMGQSNIWYGEESVNQEVINYIQQYERDYGQRLERIEANLAQSEGRERESLVKVRLNQDQFRQGLLRKFNCKCCLCGVTNEKLLIASHIKPWSRCEPFEKLDLENGLLLCPNHDKLFDLGYISFQEDGQITISDKLDETNQIYLNVRPSQKISITEGNMHYFRFHFQEIFIG